MNNYISMVGSSQVYILMNGENTKGSLQGSTHPCITTFKCKHTFIRLNNKMPALHVYKTTKTAGRSWKNNYLLFLNWFIIPKKIICKPGKFTNQVLHKSLSKVFQKIIILHCIPSFTKGNCIQVMEYTPRCV